MYATLSSHWVDSSEPESGVRLGESSSLPEDGAGAAVRGEDTLATGRREGGGGTGFRDFRWGDRWRGAILGAWGEDFNADGYS